MAGTNLLDLESSIRRLPGVLGCVILANQDGSVAEVQAFTTVGSDRGEIERSILGEVEERGLSDNLREVMVFELEAESHFGDRESLDKAAELVEREVTARGPAGRGPAPAPSKPGDASPGPDPRPVLRRVSLSSSVWRSQAHVALAGKRDEVVGEAIGDRTPHGLKILAEATLEAAGKLVGDEFALRGAALVHAFGRDAVLVLVEVAGGLETVGAALVRDGPLSDAAVRATLDAVNRRLAKLELGAARPAAEG